MRQRDKYGGFAKLASDNLEGRDYKRLVEMRPSAIALIAPHGGGIEPCTSEITRAIANGEFSYYCFEGVKSRGNGELHITSTSFDEPTCIQLVEHSQTVGAVHGCVGEQTAVYIGGLDTRLKMQIIGALRHAGFDAKEDTSNHSGNHPQNICNRGISRRGLQLEITEALRRAMFKGLKRCERRTTTPQFDKFVAAVREVLLKLEQEKASI
jgi:phage replication-related protein YjqB (UPF0714/DUF867 family)